MSTIKDGDILQIPLPKGLGFAYAKYIDLLKIHPESRYPSLLRVYRLRSIKDAININNLKNSDLVLSPVLIGGVKPIIKTGVWKIIGNFPVVVDEYIIPEYRYVDSNVANDRKDEEKKWYFLINADISKKMASTYENVKHLEPIGAIGAELIGTKIAMTFLKDEGKIITDYFEVKEYYEKVFFEQVMEIPLYYKQQEYLRGKAIR